MAWFRDGRREIDRHTDFLSATIRRSWLHKNFAKSLFPHHFLAWVIFRDERTQNKDRMLLSLSKSFRSHDCVKRFETKERRLFVETSLVHTVPIKICAKQTLIKRLVYLVSSLSDIPPGIYESNWL
jgi:hypothetical protein